jgi:hypothetical protein
MLSDLEHIAKNPSTYGFTRSSVTLRHLLLDPNGVLQQVNRSHRVKVRFPISPPAEEPDEHSFVVRGFNGNSSTGTQDQFIAQPCIWLHGYRYTVRDVIDICANKEGGAHFDRRLDAREQTLLNRTWEQDGMRLAGGGYETPLTFALAQIIFVTISALEPIRSSINKTPPVAEAPTQTRSARPPLLEWIFHTLARLLSRASLKNVLPARDARPAIIGRRFHRERVELSRARYDGCHFEECRITYDGSKPVRMRGCNLDRCTFEMNGAALNTMRWFQAMHQSTDGGKNMVLATMAEPMPNGRPRTVAWSDEPVADAEQATETPAKTTPETTQL